MSYLDELKDLLGRLDLPEGLGSSFDTDGEDENATYDSYLEQARAQLSPTNTGYYEEPEGTFVSLGTRFGCGYALAKAVVDPKTGTFDMVIDSNLHISPENVRDARRLFLFLNQTFVIPGLDVSEDSTMVFRIEHPGSLEEGDNLREFIGKGFSTIHGLAHVIAEIEAGRPAWDILMEEQAKDDD